MPGPIWASRAVFFSLLSVLGASSQPVNAATLRVPADHPTIQQAISVATSGDVIVIAPGTYYENLQLLGKELTLRGESGAATTVVDGQQAGRVIHADADCVIEGLTIRNGVSQHGAGVYVVAGSATIRDCVIEDNSALPFDAGVGGGILFGLESSGCIVEDNIIRNNYAGDSGGGFYDTGVIAPSNVRRNVFQGNGCHVGGGAARLDYTSFTENVVVANWSDSFGGGIVGGGILIANNTIVGNYNNNNFLHGAGIRVTTTVAVIRHNIVALNRGLPGWSAGAGIQAPGPVTCNNSWDNDGPDYLLSNNSGQGNISLDPLFCDPSSGDYSINASSPCAPGASACGLIGALDATCGVTSTLQTTWGRLKSIYRE
jgi:hypothetical protein